MGDLSVVGIVQKTAKPLYNIVKSVGPFILSQSKTAVENYSNFKLNKARLDAISVLLQEEVKHISEDRAKIRDKMINLNGAERVRAQNDYDLMTRELNKLSTVDKIKDFLKDDVEISNDNEISDGWIEKFNQLASSLNEEWRKKLLAKAFAKELQEPGTINMIVLNSIASFDEESFRAFGSIVNISSRLYEVNCFPEGAMSLEINTNGSKKKISQIIYELSHLNLINASGGNFINIVNNNKVLIRYGKRVIETQGELNIVPLPLQIHTVFYSTLGNKISDFYDRDITDDGNLCFDMFIDDLKKKGYTCKDILISDDDYESIGN
ncbi:hypothetical protein [Serratia inhibens]